MALPFVAFTSLDGQEYACVCRGEQDMDRLTLLRHAEEIVNLVASGIPTSMFNELHQNLKAIHYYVAIQAPYQRYLSNIINDDWIQRQAEKTSH